MSTEVRPSSGTSKKRFIAIDFLRAIGILGVIATHVFSYNLTSAFNSASWNYLHFVITSFIFCSGYVMFTFYKDKVSTIKKILPWYKKRFLRLLIPYYLYFFIHFLLFFLFPNYFTGLGLQKNWHYVLQSVFLIGGLNENWLPLLFLQLTLIFPLLVFLMKNINRVFWLYIFVAIGFTWYITVYPISYNFYRLVMWIPWSFVFILSWYFAKEEMKKIVSYTYLCISVISGVVFGLLYLWFVSLHRSVILIDNKYPPNMFYIAYEFFVSFFLLFVLQKKILQQQWLVSVMQFLSSRSYGLFFIHFLFLDFLLRINSLYQFHLSVWSELLLVTLASVVSILLWERGKVFMRVS